MGKSWVAGRSRSCGNLRSLGGACGLEQRLRGLEVGCGEPLGEAGVDRGQEVTRPRGPSLLMPLSSTRHPRAPALPVPVDRPHGDSWVSSPSISGSSVRAAGRGIRAVPLSRRTSRLLSSYVSRPARALRSAVRASWSRSAGWNRRLLPKSPVELSSGASPVAQPPCVRSLFQ
jgi:hypothetical protein